MRSAGGIELGGSAEATTRTSLGRAIFTPIVGDPSAGYDGENAPDANGNLTGICRYREQENSLDQQ
jgi:hypothetical protein